MDKLFDKDFIILDGAMGTMLQRSGMPAGIQPEVYAQAHPDDIEAIHRAYVDAGSDIISTNTFGANAKKLAGTGLTPETVIKSAVACARRAAGGRALVALDVGPTGEMMSPSGTLTFGEAYELFRMQVCAGESAGADLIFFETFSDLSELRAAVLAAKENTSLPVFASMTFDEGGRAFTGALAESFALTISGLGVDAIGINCSLGPEKVIPMIRSVASMTDLPLIVKPNAGMPDVRDGHYDMTPELFAEEMKPCAEAGVKFIGGCCGTTPEFIKELKRTFDGLKRAERRREEATYLCSATRLVKVDMPRIIGERINPTGKKRFQQALRENDLDYVLSQGVAQMDAGADILDVNVGVPGLDETDLMQKCVDGLSSVTDLPLQIDSNDPAVIEAGLRTYCGRAIINSVNGDDKKLSAVLPLAKKYGSAVVGLTMDERGIPDTAEKRFAIAEKIVSECEKYGIGRESVFIDCLCMTVSASPDAAKETLRAARMASEKLGVHCVLGVSNISFGLPNRELINRSFLALALENCVDLPILNPNVPAMTETVAAFKLLRGYDTNCEKFIELFAGAEKAPAPGAGSAAMDVKTAIAKGLSAESSAATASLLESTAPLDIVNDYLIPALDAVGDRFEKGEVFLPQLIRSADAAGAAFEVIKKKLAAEGGGQTDKGKIIVATVKGDIHDIGKNIVKTVLSNYGYRVIDLGRDVPPEKIVDTAIKENVRLVGLSALMTTTLPAMEETIALLKKSGHECKTMVGGAVLTKDYADSIGADYYAKDAKRASDIAKEVLG